MDFKIRKKVRLTFYTLMLTIVLVLPYSNTVYGQYSNSLSLNECIQLAIDYSTISKLKSVHQQITDENVKTANAGWFPKVDFNAQATYQNDVISVEPMGYTSLSKDQYKVSLDLNQVIYDGGYISHQKQLYASGLRTEQLLLDIDIQQIRERINSLYLSVLLINENVRLVELLKQDITTNIVKLSAMLSNGIALKSNVDILEAELMKADQKIIELSSNKKSTIEMLSILMGKIIPVNTVFANPTIEVNLSDTISNRPEFKLFDSQKVNLQNQSLLLDTKNMPKLYLFANNGYGRPGFNMLSNDFTYIGIAGIKLSVPLTNWASTRHEKQVIGFQQSIIDIKTEDFARNNKMQISQQVNEIDKYTQLIEKDKDIVVKRTNIKDTESIKLANGVSTSNDYLTELNAENQAMLNLKLHEIQLKQAIINYNSLKGNN